MRKIATLFMMLMISCTFISCTVEDTSSDINNKEQNVEEDKRTILKEKYDLDGGYTRDFGYAKWVIDSTASPAANDPLEWAEDYYNEYGSPDTSLWILNFANHTTTLINNNSDDGLMLYVEQSDGVDESSLSEGKVNKGTILGSYYIYYDDDNRVVKEVDDSTGNDE